MEALDLTTLATDVLEEAHTIAEETGLLAVADAALERTGNTGVAASIVGDVVDALIDWEALDLPPTLGAFLEDHDADIASWFASLVIRLAMNPARRERRQKRLKTWKQNRIDRQTKRQARREARRTA